MAHVSLWEILEIVIKQNAIVIRPTERKEIGDEGSGNTRPRHHGHGFVGVFDIQVIGILGRQTVGNGKHETRGETKAHV